MSWSGPALKRCACCRRGYEDHSKVVCGTCQSTYETVTDAYRKEGLNKYEGIKEYTKEDPSLGLYQIYWESGGSSLAAIGMDREGNRWMAPTNWTSGSTNYEDYKKGIKYLIRIR